ncbi:MAG TPA: hypothetical protein VHR72_05425 [Gemmataceae bacterium]|jgi:hypothetical protein|nr:hypothetical protein [Gemmataceae bacterium]
MMRWMLAVVTLGLISFSSIAHQPRPHADEGEARPRKVDFLELDSVQDTIVEKTLVETNSGKRFMVRLLDGRQYQAKEVGIKGDSVWQIFVADGLIPVQWPVSLPISDWKRR